MAALRRAQDIDQRRPEDSSAVGNRQVPDHPSREPRKDSRPSSPAPRAATLSSKRRTHDFDAQSSTKHSAERSRPRSVSRDRTRHRNRRGSRAEDDYRASKRESSSDRATHPHSHHHHHHRQHHRDRTSPSKRHRSRSPSPRGSHKRPRRHRSRSLERSRSRTRRADSTHRSASKGFAHRTQHSAGDRGPRRPSPEIDFYIPGSSSRRRSTSIESHYRRVNHRARKTSTSPDRRLRREHTPQQSSSGRSRRHYTPLREDKETSHRRTASRERETGHSEAPRHVRSRSSLRGRSPTSARRTSPPRSSRAKGSPRKSRSPRVSSSRRSPRSPHAASKVRSRLDTVGPPDRSIRANGSVSRRGSPTPVSGYNTDTSKERGREGNMRGAYHHQGRGGSGFQHSPSYPPSNQYSPQGQSPYHGGRGGWNAQSYPNQGYVMLTTRLIVC